MIVMNYHYHKLIQVVTMMQFMLKEKRNQFQLHNHVVLKTLKEDLIEQ